MIQEQEQVIIRILSDDELYEQAQEFMRGVARQIPPTQVNGLLNVSTASTFAQLLRFIKHQQERKTWRGDDRYVIPDFYKRLMAKFDGKEFKNYVPLITQARTEKLSLEDEQDIKMALACEFIQHLLAQNAYMGATRAFSGLTQGNDTNRNSGRPQEQARDTKYAGQTKDNRGTTGNRDNRNTGGSSQQRRRG